MPRRRLAALAAVPLCMSSLISCADRSTQHGTISGVRHLYGGPAVTDVPVPGTVYAYLTASGRGLPSSSGQADAKGRFRLQVGLGRFYLRAVSPRFTTTPQPDVPPCLAPQAVEAEADTTTVTDVYCQLR